MAMIASAGGVGTERIYYRRHDCIGGFKKVIQEINVLTHPIFMKIRSDVLDILYNLTFRVHETINSITVRCCLEQFVWDVIETCKNYEGG